MINIKFGKWVMFFKYFRVIIGKYILVVISLKYLCNRGENYVKGSLCNYKVNV